jgi:hypothetical protein
MDVLPAMVQLYSYNEMFNEGGGVEKQMAGGAPVNHMIDGGAPFIDKVVPIGLATVRSQPNRYMEFADVEDLVSVNYRIDVLSDAIFDQFIDSVSRKSASASRTKSKTLRIKKRI